VEERSVGIPPEGPPPGAVESGSPGGLADPRALQILSTEHWSLLAARSLVYNEAFARAGMFLSFLSATLVALGLVATATGFSDGFLVIAAVILVIDMFIGFASLARIASASAEDILLLQAMNRIRHAYVDISPGVAPYFVMGYHDDPESVLAMYGPAVTSPLRNVVHGFTTTPGMIGVITSGVGGTLAAVLTMLGTHDSTLAGTIGALAFLALNTGLVVLTSGRIRRFFFGLEVRFPKEPPNR
jgi:cytochrome c biogenesis protein CcdA